MRRFDCVHAWFFQTTVMMIPFIMGGCIGIVVFSHASILNMLLGIGLFRLFCGKKTFQGWGEQEINDWFNAWECFISDEN